MIQDTVSNLAEPVSFFLESEQGIFVEMIYFGINVQAQVEVDIFGGHLGGSVCQASAFGGGGQS